MAKFGWAYVNARHPGSPGSIQFIQGETGETNGSDNFTFEYNEGDSVLSLTGSLIVSGAISATTMNILSTTVTEIDQQGNSRFGDSNDDTHTFSGSLQVMSSSTAVLGIDMSKNRTTVSSFAGKYRSAGVADTAVTPVASDYIIGVKATGSIEVHLVPANVGDEGMILVIKDESGLNRSLTSSIRLTSSNDAAWNIDGSASYDIVGENGSVNLYSNGSNWFIH